jgi:hypothetical protein
VKKLSSKFNFCSEIIFIRNIQIQLSNFKAGSLKIFSRGEIIPSIPVNNKSLAMSEEWIYGLYRPQSTQQYHNHTAISQPFFQFNETFYKLWHINGQFIVTYYCHHLHVKAGNEIVNSRRNTNSMHVRHYLRMMGHLYVNES